MAGNVPSVPQGAGGSLVQPDRPQTVGGVAQAVAFRRYQRWFFYALFVAIIVGCIFIITKNANENAALVAKLSQASETLSAQQKDLAAKDAQIQDKEKQLLQSNNTIQDARAEVQKAKQDIASYLTQNQTYIKQVDDLQMAIQAAQALATSSQSISKNLILKLGVPISHKDLGLLPLGPLPADMTGLDTDKDGIPDWFEAVIGTDPMLADTDKDGYSDLDEINKGFNPLGPGKLPADAALMAKYKGMIVLDKADPNATYAWYINLVGQRFFLGSSADNYQNLLTSNYWNK